MSEAIERARRVMDWADLHGDDLAAALRLDPEFDAEALAIVTDALLSAGDAYHALVPGRAGADSSPSFDPLPAEVIGLADRLSYPLEFDESVVVLFDGPNHRVLIHAKTPQ